MSGDLVHEKFLSLPTANIYHEQSQKEVTYILFLLWQSMLDSRSLSLNNQGEALHFWHITGSICQEVTLDKCFEQYSVNLRYSATFCLNNELNCGIKDLEL